jgi:hypothetical protein
MTAGVLETQLRQDLGAAAGKGLALLECSYVLCLTALLWKCFDTEPLLRVNTHVCYICLVVVLSSITP